MNIDQFIPLECERKLTVEEIKRFKRDAIRKIEMTSDNANIMLAPGDTLKYEYIVEFGKQPIYSLCGAINTGPPCHLKMGHTGPHKSVNSWDNPKSKDISDASITDDSD